MKVVLTDLHGTVYTYDVNSYAEARAVIREAIHDSGYGMYYDILEDDEDDV